MTSHKKAQMRKSIIGIIIAIIAAGIILFFMGAFSDVFSGSMNKETCRTSVNARATIIEGGFLAETAMKLPPLKCKTEYKCLSKDGECEGDYKKVKINGEEEIKKEIAGMMYECWDMLGRGEKSFIGSWEGDALLDDQVCVICTVIDFDDKIKAQEKITGLNEYIYKTQVPGKDFTYLEFISNKEGIKMNIQGEDSISAKQKQSIIFTVGKTSSWENILTASGGGGLGGLAGLGLIFLIPGVGPAIVTGVGLAGAASIVGIGTAAGGWAGSLYDSEHTTSLAVVPYESEEIKKYCKDMKSFI